MLQMPQLQFAKQGSIVSNASDANMDLKAIDGMPSLGGPESGVHKVEHPYVRAVALAREIDEILQNAHEISGPPSSPAAYSSRLAMAMAAGLLDQLQQLVRKSAA